MIVIPLRLPRSADDPRALAAEIGFHPRVLGGQHGGNRPGGDDLAVGQDGDAVAHRMQAVEIVRHHEDREPQRALQGADQVVELAGADRIEPRGRLVEKDDLGIERERAGERHPLGHAAGQFGGILVADVGRSPTISSLASAISSSSRCDSRRYSRIGNWTFWRTVSEENSAPCWNRMPQRRSSPRRSVSVATSRSTPNTSIAPVRRGTRPMMVRISTDLPAPEAPTNPRISPRNTSTHSPSSTTASPKPTTRSRTLITASLPPSAIAHIPIEAKNIANRPSSTITRKIDLTTESVVLRPSDSVEPLTSSPCDAGDDADHQRHERRLDQADREIIERDRLLQPRQEYVRRHAAIEPAHQAAAIERRHRAEEGQDRHCDDQRAEARQDQHLDGVEAHGAQGVDFLAHLHRAELGGVGRAGAPRHHDGDHQDADLAQHQDADHVDDIDLGAEAAEMEDALLSDDRRRSGR